jgi:hypothetical protein
MDTSHAATIVDVAGLVIDAAALSEALLAGDLSEARFRAALVASCSEQCGLDGVQVAAFEVVRLLGAPGQPPLPGYAQAVLALSDELGQALVFLHP